MIIFTGVAGSGKSVQGKLLADKLGLPWLSTGEFLRMLVSGTRRKEMVAGKLLDDKEIIKLVQKIFALIDTQQEFVLDGFPRTLTQADWLIHQVKHGQLDITALVHLKADRETVKARLMARGRQDDTEKAIEGRFAEYEQAIMPILNEFKKSGVKVIEVDGDQPIGQVHASIKEQLQAIK